MRISKKAGLMFIHIPKNAGRSIWVAMESKYPDTKKLAKEHALLSEAWKPRFKKLKTFAVIRNPWDRMVSLYHFQSQFKKTCETKRYGVVSGDQITEAGFKKWLLKYGKISCGHELTKVQQIDWLTLNGKIAINKIVRFENLREDLLGATGLELGGDRKHESKHVHYSEYYDDETRDFVAKRFNHDIIEWGYGFNVE